jgi:hypothetical protein
VIFNHQFYPTTTSFCAKWLPKFDVAAGWFLMWHLADFYCGSWRKKLRPILLKCRLASPPPQNIVPPALAQKKPAKSHFNASDELYC